MRISIFSKKSTGGQLRHNLSLATAIFLLSSCLSLGIAFGQETPQGPPPDQPQGQEDRPGMGRGMGGHHRQMPSVDDQLRHMSKQLKLSDEQQAKLRPILEDRRKQMDQIRSDSSLSRQDRFSKMRELHENTGGCRCGCHRPAWQRTPGRRQLPSPGGRG